MRRQKPGPTETIIVQGHGPLDGCGLLSQPNEEHDLYPELSGLVIDGKESADVGILYRPLPPKSHLRCKGLQTLPTAYISRERKGTCPPETCSLLGALTYRQGIWAIWCGQGVQHGWGYLRGRVVLGM